MIRTMRLTMISSRRRLMGWKRKADSAEKLCDTVESVITTTIPTDTCHQVTHIMFVCAMTLCYSAAISHILDTIYSDRNTLLLSKLAATFLYLQVMVNWGCLRYLNSWISQASNSEAEKYISCKALPPPQDRFACDAILKSHAESPEYKSGGQRALGVQGSKSCSLGVYCIYFDTCVVGRHGRQLTVLKAWSLIASSLILMHAVWYNNAVNSFVCVYGLKYNVLLAVTFAVLVLICWLFLSSFCYCAQVFVSRMITFIHQRPNEGRKQPASTSERSGLENSCVESSSTQYWWLHFFIPFCWLVDLEDCKMNLIDPSL